MLLQDIYKALGVEPVDERSVAAPQGRRGAPDEAVDYIDEVIDEAVDEY